ncbi:MAG TPA: hypothetical protein VLI69_03310 [Gammaproteobacteria bacterium]|nr:hypothetical protein [Gammaproteobacteria bacterium]
MENNSNQPVIQKRKLLIFNEAQILKGLSAKKAHADEIIDIHHGEFEDHE